MTIFKRAFERLKEPSTWAGLSVIGGFIGLNPAYLTSIQGVVTAVAAALAVFIPEKSAGQ